ncbi:hypothetical protein ACUN0C_18665 [Faunimonas sp. B44]|uniref:hypothetical protein n=1 Tax=Faunimonas sp. B44 TaxID=3461493 RepID=UPI004043F06D
MIKDILSSTSPMIALIKAYRQETGCSLLEAKHAVEAAFKPRPQDGEHIIVVDDYTEVFTSLEDAMSAAYEYITGARQIYIARVVARTTKSLEYV